MKQRLFSELPMKALIISHYDQSYLISDPIGRILLPPLDQFKSSNGDKGDRNPAEYCACLAPSFLLFLTMPSGVFVTAHCCLPQGLPQIVFPDLLPSRGDKLSPMTLTDQW